MMKISVAIPTFNSSKYFYECVKPFLKITNISEIIVCDDNSKEDDVDNLENIINKINKSRNAQIKLIKNDLRVGAYKNKLNAIKHCTSEFVYQIDSDNIPGKSIEKIIQNTQFEKDLIYFPSSIKQFRNIIFSKLFNEHLVLSEKTTVLDNIAINSEIKSKEIIKDKDISWVLNIGNFIVHRENYIKTIEPTIESATNLSADAMAISYYWIKSNKNIVLLNDFYHYHRKRPDSVSFTEGKNSLKSIEFYLRKFKELP